jgi:hypothetical protein
MNKKIKSAINNFFEHPKSVFARIVKDLIILLIILSTISMFIEIFAHPFHQSYTRFFYLLEIFIVSIFTVEYLLRLFAAPNKLEFIFNFYNTIDFLAIAPFYLELFAFQFIGVARILRMLRLTRMFRLAKLLKYSKTTLAKIMRENILKNIIIVFFIFLLYPQVKEFLYSVNIDHLDEVLYACTIINLAAMLGGFNFSYEFVNPYKVMERLLSHLTSALLLLPVGLIFVIIQIILTRQLGQDPYIITIAIWFVFFALILWDFWNVKKIEKFIKKKSLKE